MMRIIGPLFLCAALAAAPALSAQKPKTPPPATQKPKAPVKPPAKPAEQPKPAAPAPKPGLTMRTSYTGTDCAPSETRLVNNGTRQRVELGQKSVVITQCDTKQILQVSD